MNEQLAGLQALWTAVGVAAFILTLFFVRRVRDLQRYKYTFLFIGLVLLVLPFIPSIGVEQFGARIWVKIGPVNFQPGEATKLVLAIFFAAYLVDRRELLAHRARAASGPFNVPDPKYLGPIFIVWGISLVVMIAQKDLGTSLLFFALFVVMLWVATERPSWLVVGAVLFVAGAWFAVANFAHVQERVDIWLDPWRDIDGNGYQIAQAAFAMASGGVTGTGLGLNNVGIPLVESDFIFASVAEQLGLLGATVILTTFLLMIGSGLRIATRTVPAVREAARHRPHRAARHTGVHHHRRRHAPAPAHRCDAAVRFLRRVVARRELRACSRCSFASPIRTRDRPPPRADTSTPSLRRCAA